MAVKTATSKETKTEIYEIGFMFISTIPEGDVASRFVAIKETIEKEGATFISEEMPKIRPLAYSMRKKIDNVYKNFDSGYFGWVKFETTGTAILKIKQLLDANLDILRFLIIKTAKENTMVGSKLFSRETSREVKSAPHKNDAVVSGKSKMTEAEMDKTIEELVA